MRRERLEPPTLRTAVGRSTSSAVAACLPKNSFDFARLPRSQSDVLYSWNQPNADDFVPPKVCDYVKENGTYDGESLYRVGGHVRMRVYPTRKKRFIVIIWFFIFYLYDFGKIWKMHFWKLAGSHKRQFRSDNWILDLGVKQWNVYIFLYIICKMRQ